MNSYYGSIGKLSRVLFSLMFLLCIFGLSQGAYAENRLSLTEVTGYPGGEVTIEARVSLDQDLQVMGWTIKFDPKALTLENCEVLYDADAVPMIDEVSQAADGIHKVVYEDTKDLVALTAPVTDRPLIRYTFKIADSVQIGTDLPITLSWTPDNEPLDKAGNKVASFVLTGGKIEVR